MRGNARQIDPVVEKLTNIKAIPGYDSKETASNENTMNNNHKIKLLVLVL